MELENIISKIQTLKDEGDDNQIIELLSHDILEKFNSPELYLKKASAYLSTISVFDEDDVSINTENLAHECYLKALDINPNNAETYIKLGHFYTSTSQTKEGEQMIELHKKAEQTYTKALKYANSRETVRLYTYLGVLYTHCIEDKEEARNYFLKAIDIEPDNPTLYDGLACVALDDVEFRVYKNKSEEFKGKNRNYLRLDIIFIIMGL